MKEISSTRCMLYNIQSGGFSPEYSVPLYPRRIPHIIDVVKRVNPDIVGFVDTYGWHQTLSRRDVGELFGQYPYVDLVPLADKRLQSLGTKPWGHDNGLAFLSHPPVLDSTLVWLGSRNALRTTVDIGGAPTDFFLGYFDDVSEDTRLMQAERLMQYVREVPTVLMGDLNTMNLGRLRIVRDLLTRVFPNLPKQYWPKIWELTAGKTVSYLQANGFRQASGSRPTVPTKLLHTRLPIPILALDQVWYRGSVNVKNLRVVRNKQADGASDHYPIAFSLSWRYRLNF